MFEASLVYRVSSRTARAMEGNPVSKNQKKKKKCRGAGTSAPELAGSYLEVWPPGVCKQLTLFYLFLAVIRGS